MACADAGVFLVSPFVGRITDWHAKAEGKTYTSENDPGVKSVREIYSAYKSRRIKTVVMGASFRNTGQIEALAGCDRLTISPALLAKLDSASGALERRLYPEATITVQCPATDEASFRWAINQDAMATEKLADGIRQFGADLNSLHALIYRKLRPEAG